MPAANRIASEFWRAASGTLVRSRSVVVALSRDSGRLPRRLAGSLLIGLTCLAACDGGNGEAPTATTVASASTPAASGSGTGGDESGPAAVPQIGAVVWAVAIAPETNEPIDRVERFPADAPTLYAVVPVSYVASGTELSATWTYHGVPLEGLDRVVVFDAPPEATTWVEFHLRLAEGETWPVGTYEIALSVDGQDVRTATVEVVEDEEPEA